MEYDVIGDVHGQDGKLLGLLTQLGYRPSQGAYRHPEGRVAVFVGDLIDRGPGQIEVLELVRAMVEAGSARVVMGNHEFNAIGFATLGEGGRPLRPDVAKNRKQHAAFLAQVGEGSALHREWVDWFKGLPLYLDLNGIRVVHGWWDEDAVALLEGNYRDTRGKLAEDFVYASHVKGSPQEAARKCLTCGVEWDLPEGYAVVGKEGQRHGEARLAVWRHWASRLPEIALVPSGNAEAVPDLSIPPELACGPIEGSPIFFGHYWFSGEVAVETPKVACLDWSAGKGGPLVAYRWQGEEELTNAHFAWVN